MRHNAEAVDGGSKLFVKVLVEVQLNNNCDEPIDVNGYFVAIDYSGYKIDDKYVRMQTIQPFAYYDYSDYWLMPKEDYERVDIIRFEPGW